MSPIYADHPFSLLESPLSRERKEDPNIKSTDDDFLYTASEMCTVHNLIVRGLNSIYLQAPHIKPADEKYFCEYIKIWCLVVLTHHHEEEEYFFPWVEKLTGVKGLMDGNLEQHKAFHGGLEELDEYAKGVLAGKEKFDGGKVVEVIDGFGKVLTEHLSDEIPTLMALKQYGEIFSGVNSLVKKFQELGKQAMGSVTMGQLSVMFSNVDVDYEGGLWANWPPAPGIVKLIIRWIVFPLQTNLTKFGACDKYGRLRPLYAVPVEESKI